jgi:hypothetical protein
MKGLVKPEVIDTLLLAISGAIASTVVLLIFALTLIIKQPDQLIDQQIAMLPSLVLGAAGGGIIFGGPGWAILKLTPKMAERMTTQDVSGGIGGMLGMMTVFYWLLLSTPFPSL